ncbi:RNA polymerase sigma factor [Humisphaera borealis]|uniref:Sigma-70 family RNA polymerase sigma factor n=1 Tax=Humisphaera borealis TaxID=2807512 RepID=A0A7M2WSE5_9BACT|nr:sigma-70 family RNA polymerase sigma factor [Humisphaera borealis]QOV88363.1 sigma-70 family RNA polymerase sigma factor [Humisphaera borealis]
MDPLPQDSEAIITLVRRAQERDADAFAALIGRFERVALSVAYGTLGDPHAAGDAVQDGFTKAWEKVKDLKDPGRFGTWLCGIVRNGAIDQRRRARLAPRAPLDSAPEAAAPASATLAGRDWADDPSRSLESREQEELLGKAIEELDDVSRTIVVLRYFQGLSSKEIGQIVEMNATAVDMRLSRARQQLKQTLLTNQAFAEESARTA